jgi:NAD-dependent deacetylase
VRPAVVWFGEALPPEAWRAAQDAAASCDVFVCIGTSGVVQPAASLPLIARAAGAFTAEINLEASALDGALDVHLYGPAGTILPALMAELNRPGAPRSPAAGS